MHPWKSLAQNQDSEGAIPSPLECFPESLDLPCLHFPVHSSTHRHQISVSQGIPGSERSGFKYGAAPTFQQQPCHGACPDPGVRHRIPNKSLVLYQPVSGVGCPLYLLSVAWYC